MSAKKGKDPLFSRDGYHFYPEEIPIYPTHEEFPYSEHLYQKMNSPVGILARPFIYNNVTNMKKREGELTKQLAEIARCSECGAYINPYCDINTLRWFCSLCDKKNSYSKPHVRYRHIDPKLVPELKNALVDLDVPLREKGQVYALPATKRPFIHILLIQENMQIDTIEATIDSIRKSTSSTHPDICFVLLTFSHQRIGIYSLKGETPIVQYNHFLYYDPAEMAWIPVEALSDESIGDNDQSPTIRSSLALSDIVGFQVNCTRLGDCRLVLNESLSSILNAQSDENLSLNNETIIATFQLIKRWIVKRTQTIPSSQAPATETDVDAAGIFDFSRIFNVLSSYTDLKKSNTASSSRKSHVTNDSFEYTGIILHVFADNLQTTFPTVTAYQSFQDELKALTKQFIQLAVSVNLYAVCAYEKDQCDLSSWKLLAQNTGGQLHRITLGYSPPEAITYFTALLQRIFTQSYATRCQMKLRTSSRLLYHYEEDVGGSLCTKLSSEEETAASLSLEDGIISSPRSKSGSVDEYDNPNQDLLPIDIPGVYSIPVMSEDSCYGFKFQYIDRGVASSNAQEEFDSVYYQKQARQTKTYLFVQIALSYETLVPSSNLVDNKVMDAEGHEAEDTPPYIQHICEQIGLNLTELLKKDENQQIYQVIYPSNNESEGSSIPINSGSAKIPKKISSYVTGRRFHTVPHNTSLEVIRQLRVITYGIECTKEESRLKSNMILPNLFALIIKINHTKMLLEENQWMEERLQQRQQQIENLKNHPEQQTLNTPSDKKDPTDDEFYNRRGFPIPPLNQSTSSKEIQEEKQVNQTLITFQQNEFNEISLLNSVVHAIHGKIHEYEEDFQYRDYTKQQLFQEIFHEINLTGNLSIYYLHHLSYLIYSYLIFSQRYNASKLENHPLHHHVKQNKGKEKRTASDISYHYSDEYIAFWWKIQYYQSMIIYRLFVPNFLALEEEQQQLESKNLGEEDVAKKEEVSENEWSSPKENSLTPNPLLDSKPLQIISMTEERPQLPPPPPLPPAVQYIAPSVLSMDPPKVPTSLVVSSKRTDFFIKSQFLSLRRDNIFATGCSYFLLDAMNKFIFYRALQASTPFIASTVDATTEEANSSSTNERKTIFPFLMHRLYEFPILPRLLQSQAGSSTAPEFMDYFLEDTLSSEISFTQFMTMIEHLISSSEQNN